MARLRFSGPTADDIAATFSREGRLIGKRALRHMRKVSQAVLKTSVENAPVDYKGRTRNSEPLHELEKAHKITEAYGNMRRLEATVEVGGMVGDVDVDAYAAWIHDGSYSLGPASIAKGPQVGPRFLERALEDHEEDIDALLDEALEGLML